MPKPALTAHQIELREKLHKRCETVKRQNQTRIKLLSGRGCLIIHEGADDMPINCRNIRNEAKFVHLSNLPANYYDLN